jgi:hypothetical protein
VAISKRRADRAPPLIADVRCHRRGIVPNGKHGDHPLTDILIHHAEVYGPDVDDLIRKIAALSSRRELDQWWEREIGWTPEPSSVLAKAQTHYAELLKRANDSGWESSR